MRASTTTKSTVANDTDSLPNKANVDTEVVAVNGKASTTTRRPKPPRWGPEPTLTSRKEMDVLYVLLQAVSTALTTLDIDYIVTGGSLLGAVRQASILFCDDDVDISILDPHYYNNDDDDDERSVYATRVRPALQTALGPDFCYKQRAWEGGDRVYYGHSSVFVDLFVICKYNRVQDLEQVLSVKANGKPQSSAYAQGILSTIFMAAQKVGQEQQQQDSSLPLLEPPFWHFAQRKAVELWPREVYRHWELWPLVRNLQMGPCTGICGPRLPVLLLQRAFGHDCFDVYYPSIQHNNNNNKNGGGSGDGAKGVVASSAVIEKKGVAPTSKDNLHIKDTKDATFNNANISFPPKVLPGGTWEHATKTPLLEEHYIPIQPTSKAKRKPNHHCRQVLMEYLQRQRQVEAQIVEQHLAWRRIVASLVPQDAAIAVPEKESSRRQRQRPRRTVYMDGVFDLFHVGHLAAIRHCAARGDRVIIGVTGDQDAASYKRKPIICQYERCTIVAAMADVNEIVCPCPLIVTESFMQAYDIDLVVHGFLNDEDAQRQAEFFAYPVDVGKFERIPYYEGQSTTDIIKLIQAAAPMV